MPGRNGKGLPARPANWAAISVVLKIILDSAGGSLLGFVYAAALPSPVFRLKTVSEMRQTRLRGPARPVEIDI